MWGRGEQHHTKIYDGDKKRRRLRRRRRSRRGRRGKKRRRMENKIEEEKIYKVWV